MPRGLLTAVLRGKRHPTLELSEAPAAAKSR
jgi:hypothetical protein